VTPALIGMPSAENTARNPSDTAPAEAMARSTRPPRSVPSSSRPMKYDRYAGSIGNPHGFTAATSPAVNA
jgi:hypothetical protein